MAGSHFDKDPEAERTFGIDWRNVLPPGVTLEDVEWSVPPGLTEGESDLSGSAGVLRLSGGVTGTSYEVLGVAVFSNGERDPRRIVVTIKRVGGLSGGAGGGVGVGGIDGGTP